MNHFGEKADDCILTFSDAGDNLATTQMSIKDYLHKKVLYLSRIYFVMHSRTSNFGLGSPENVVSQTQEEFKGQCNRLVFSIDISFKFCENFDGDVQGPVSQEAQSQHLGIQNSAQPTKNENIEIRNVSSPSQILSLIRNRQINQEALEN